MSTKEDLWDLAELRTLGSAVDPPSGPGPDLAKRVNMSFADERRSEIETQSKAKRPKSHRRRLIWRLSLASGLATVLAGAILVGQVATVGDHKPTQVASAADILRGAALAAARDKTPDPRPDQFIYRENLSDFEWDDPNDPGVLRSQTWLSVDGTRDGMQRIKDASMKTPAELMRWGCGPERPRATSTQPESKVGTGHTEGLNPKPTGPCLPDPAYRKDLPTTPEAALKWLYDNSHGDNPRDVQAFTTLGDLIRDYYLPAASRAAFFEAVSGIEGITVIKEVKDLAGRTGVGVGFDDSKLIFDPKTYAYLGMAKVASKDLVTVPHQAGKPSRSAGPQIREGAQLRPAHAVLKVAIVDQIRQLP